jgi:hypothetical protein
MANKNIVVTLTNGIVNETEQNIETNFDIYFNNNIFVSNKELQLTSNNIQKSIEVDFDFNISNTITLIMFGKSSQKISNSIEQYDIEIKPNENYIPNINKLYDVSININENFLTNNPTNITYDDILKNDRPDIIDWKKEYLFNNEVLGIYTKDTSNDQNLNNKFSKTAYLWNSNDKLQFDIKETYISNKPELLGKDGYCFPGNSTIRFEVI